MNTDITRRLASFPNLKCRVEVVRLTVLERRLGLALADELEAPPTDGLLPIPLYVGMTSFFSRGRFNLVFVSLRICSVADMTGLVLGLVLRLLSALTGFR
jgi:hypothetical protein